MDSILIGPDTFVEEELLHRVFEESIMQNRCLDKTALIYEGKIKVLNFFSISMSHRDFFCRR